MADEQRFPTAPYDVRLVVCDMDGTLLDGHGGIPESFWPLLERMTGSGVVFAPASGRQLATLARMFARADQSAIAYIAENSTIVEEAGEVLSTTLLDGATAQRAVTATRAAAGSRDLGIVVCGRRSAYIERVDEPFTEQVEPYYARLEIVDDLTTVTDDVLKVAIYDFADSAAAVEEVYADLRADHQVVLSGRHWVDIMDARANKGVGVRAIQQRLGITPAQTVVFGDYLNDLEMLEAGDLSFAMANAHPQVLERARYAAPANTEDGVAAILSRLL
ncbi:Cof-type HAD-IIB family hydrolase [Actinomycetota bacterium]